jgi:MoaA/NifB/PqqE/SkfB family radical SAM enzyme
MRTPSVRPLRELRIELLLKCTLACVHCSAGSSPAASRSLSPELVLRLLHEGKELGVETVIFTGGEPLIDPNLVTYVSNANELGIQSTIFTAGFLQQETVEKRMADLARAGLRQVNVSLYSTDPEVNARITRKPDSLALSQTTLMTALRNGLEAEIHFVPMAPNIEDLEAVAAWAERNGITRLSVLHYVPQGRARTANDSLAPAPTDERRLRRRIEQIIKECPKLAIHVGSSFGFLELSKPVSCESGFSTLSVRSDGLVFPCDAFKGIADAVFLGNGQRRLDLTKMSLADVWSSCPYLRATRRFINENTPTGGIRCAQGCVSQSIYRGIA